MDTTTIAEVWKPVVGYEGLYEASNLGGVRCCRIRKSTLSPRNRPLSQAMCNWGYFAVGLCKNSVCTKRQVHLIVLEAHVGGRPTPNHQCNHKNGIKTDNRLENLEWVTRSENIRHAYRTRLLVVPGSEAHYMAKFSNEDAVSIVLQRRSGAMLKDICKRYGVTASVVGRIARGQSWRIATAGMFGDAR
mgnify:CR=1 FL=1|jgi:hypothetical protein